MGEVKQFYTMADVIKILPTIDWLWPGWLPRGLITLCVGVPGIGKTSLGLAVVQSVIEAKKWPDDAPGPTVPQRIVWCDTESRQAILASRITAWGLPADQFVLPLDDSLGTLELNNPVHRKQLEQVLGCAQPALLVVDSLSGAHQLDENSAREMKGLCQYLAELAKKYYISILAIHHVRKAHIKEDARIDLDRIRGSSMFRQLFVCIWVIQEMGGELRLEVRKTNIGDIPDSLGLVLTECGVEFTEAAELRGDKLDQALSFLRSTLSAKPLAFENIEIVAKQNDISRRQLYKAKRILGAKTVRDGWVL